MDDVAGQSAAAEASTTSIDAEPSNDVAGPSATEAIDGGHVDGRILPRLVNGWARHPTVLERYYTSHTLSNHQCVHVHSNGVCVLAVSPSHPMLHKGDVKVKSIAYRTHDSKNLMQTSVSGKKKAGAVFILPRDMVCTVTLSDESTVTLYGCIRASVIEINTRLLANHRSSARPRATSQSFCRRWKRRARLARRCSSSTSRAR